MNSCLESTVTERILTSAGQRCVDVIGPDSDTCRALHVILASSGLTVRMFSTAEEFLADFDQSGSGGPRCLIADVRLSGMSGVELLRVLRERGLSLPTILFAGHAEVSTVVKAVKAGALEFLEKPLVRNVVLDRVQEALDLDARNQQQRIRARELRQRLSRLTPREREVLGMMRAGLNNKAIATRFMISVQTAAKHTSRVLHKMQVSNAVELANLMHDGVGSLDERRN